VPTSGPRTPAGFQLLLLGPIGGYLAVRGLGVGLRNRTGLVAPVATAYVVVLAVLLATGGKHYYTLGLLVALAAAGAARSSPALPAPAPGRPRSSWFVWIAAIAGLVPLPSALPVLPAPVYAATPWAAINDDQLNTIGWPTVVAQVRDVVDQQPAGVVVLSQNYGEACAWSWFTGRPAWSGHNGYADWNPHPRAPAPSCSSATGSPTPTCGTGAGSRPPWTPAWTTRSSVRGCGSAPARSAPGRESGPGSGTCPREERARNPTRVPSSFARP